MIGSMARQMDNVKREFSEGEHFLVLQQLVEIILERVGTQIVYGCKRILNTLDTASNADRHMGSKLALEMLRGREVVGMSMRFSANPIEIS